MGGYDTDGTDHSHEVDSEVGWEKQCGVCRKWFFSSSKWEKHERRRDSGCRKHRVCFAWEENYNHARYDKHDRCFVANCDSNYATEGGWKDSAIRAHVRDAHTAEGSESSSSD